MHLSPIIIISTVFASFNAQQPEQHHRATVTATDQRTGLGDEFKKCILVKVRLCLCAAIKGGDLAYFCNMNLFYVDVVVRPGSIRISRLSRMILLLLLFWR